ncbi:MAG TPA: glycerol-3-phosphate 1-O-acyltransferase PlsY [Terriglobales bacterium]|nr:glycerol-3-phosphate 1-O-acyltransferase PlsY [Terriglobales bacterium]
MNVPIIIVISYVLGSIPFGYLLIRIFRGQDIRQSGSGNIGATNVSRTSPILGAVTLLLDALKGIAAVLITRAFFPSHSGLMGLAAFMAVAGHVFPVWLRFRGGKGVATGLGSFLVLVPKVVLIMIGVFLAIFLMFRYISLASILTVALFPLIAWLINPSAQAFPLFVFMSAASILIVLKHHANIARLLAGTEPKFQRRHG